MPKLKPRLNLRLKPKPNELVEKENIAQLVKSDCRLPYPLRYEAPTFWMLSGKQ
jgi:hypothetical protein